jgi:ligand-binding SRPBCC domain-containing protein
VGDCVTITRHGRRGSVLRAVTSIPRPLDETFAFFADARNLEEITPPSLGFVIASDVGDGTTVRDMLIDYRISMRGIPMRWRTRITRYDPPHAFVDEQLHGPYRLWRHVHRFEADGDHATLMTDEVWYRPIGPWPLAWLADRVFVGREVRGIFAWRAERLRELLTSKQPRV